MEKTTRLVLFALLVQLSTQCAAERRNYIGVAVEFNPWDDTDRNLFDYEDIIQTASSFSADIVVFPEGTLAVGTSHAVPFPKVEDKVIPYKHDYYKQYQILAKLSQAAATNKIYVVVNTIERANCTSNDDCPERGYFLYNSNIVFDRKGMVIATYRKFNLFIPFGIDKPKKADLATFETDFGVTFGMFTCFDILFKTPAVDLVRKLNIQDIIFPTYWFGELPFLTAAQIQVGWSYAMNVKMVASGANDPPTGSSGSGIYIGRLDKLNWMMELEGTGMIIKNLTVNGLHKTPSDMAHQSKKWFTPKKLSCKKDPSVPMAEFKELDLKGTRFDEKICQKGLCCTFNITYRGAAVSNQEKYSYRAVVFSGERYYRLFEQHKVQYCAVLLCIRGNCTQKPANGKFPLIFGSMEVRGDFPSEDSLQMPNTLVYKPDKARAQVLNTMDYDTFSYETKKNVGKNTTNVAIKLMKDNQENVITFGIYGRIFS